MVGGEPSMSRTIEERIVGMRFDNKQFKEGISETLTDLQKLDKGLQLKEGTKGLQGISAAAKATTLDSVGSSVESINSKFSVMGIIGMTALAEITRGAMSAGRSLIKNIFDPIVEGGKRRALNIEQAKFQFKGLGMDVEATMADASYAVDGTAYSLDAAAKVAGQLGASGMRAGEEMRSSLRAISGVAAMAGSSYEDVGNIFTKVAGQGRLMGDDLLRMSSRGINAAAILAKELGTTEAAVRKMVSNGQIDFKMFSEAMDKAFGEHATAANETFTGALSNMKAALARTGAPIATSAMENLMHVFNAIRPVINNVNKALEPFNKWLDTIFISARKLVVGFFNQFDEKWFENLTSSMKETTGEATRFQRIFAGVKVILEFVWTIAKGLGKTFVWLFNVLKPVFDLMISTLAVIGDLLVKGKEAMKPFIDQLVKMGDSFKEWTKNIGLSEIPMRILTGIVEGLTKGIEWLNKQFRKKDDVTTYSESLDTMASKAGPLSKLGDILSTIFGVIQKGIEKVAPLFEWAWGVISKVFNLIKEQVSKLMETMTGDGVANIIKNGLIFTLISGVTKLVDSLKSGTDSFKGLVDNIQTLLDGVAGALKAWQNDLNAGALKKIATALLILAGALLILSMIDTDKMLVSLGAATTMMVELMVAMKVLEKFVKPGITTMMATGVGLVSFSLAILLMAGALKKISDIDTDKMLGSLGALSAIIISLGITAKLMDGVKIKASTGVMLLVLAIAVKILAGVAKSVADIPWTSALKATGLIAMWLGSLVAAMAILNKMQPSPATSAAIMYTMAGAVKTLGDTALIIADIPWRKALKATGVMSTLLIALATSARIMGESKITLRSSIAILAMGYTVKILGGVALTISEIPWRKAIKSTGVMSALIGVLSVSMVMLDKVKITARTVLAIATMSYSVKMLGELIDVISPIPWRKAIKSAGIISIFIGALASSMVIMDGVKIGVRTSIAILTMGLVIRMLGQIVDIIAPIPWRKAIKATGVISTFIASLVISMLMLDKVKITARTSGTVLMFGIVVQMLGITAEKLSEIPWRKAIKSTGMILVFMAGLTLSIKTMDKAKISARTVVMILAMTKSIQMLGDLVKMISEIPWTSALKGLLVVEALLISLTASMLLIDGVGGIGASVSMILMATALKILSASLIDMASVPWTSLIKSLGAFVAILAIVAVGISVFAALAPAIVTLSGALMSAVIPVAALGLSFIALGAGLQAIASAASIGAAGIGVAIGAILKELPKLFKVIGEGFIEFIKVLIDNADTLKEAFISFGTMIIDGLINLMPKVGELLLAFITMVIDTLLEAIPQFIELGVTLITGFLQGVMQVAPTLVDTGILLIKELLRGVRETVPDIVETAFSVMLSLLKGIRDNIGELVTVGIETMVNFVLGIAESLGLVIDAAFKTVIAFINGLADAIRNNSVDLAAAGLNLLSAVLEGMVGIGAMFMDIGGEIVSGVWEGIKSMGSWLTDQVGGFFGGIVDGVKDFFGIASPSKLFKTFGGFIVEGFGIGIDDNADIMSSSMNNLYDVTMKPAQRLMDDLVNLLDDDPDFSPTITPVLDMDMVDEGLAGLLDQQLGIGIATKGLIGLADAITEKDTNPKQTQVVNNVYNTYEFEQNNTSPEALSQIDIYRRTKLQFDMFRKVTE